VRERTIPAIIVSRSFTRATLQSLREAIKSARVLSRFRVEGSNSMVKPFEKYSRSPREYSIAALPKGRHKVESEADLEHCHWKLIQIEDREAGDQATQSLSAPGWGASVRTATLLSRTIIRRTSGGSISSPWNSSITKSGPVLGKRAANSVPKPELGFLFFFVHGGAQNVADLFFHAAAVDAWRGVVGALSLHSQCCEPPAEP
jgi:hypothetical protein